MKQIYKKLLAAALGVSMLLSMVGCGQNDTSDPVSYTHLTLPTSDLV